MKKMKKYVEIVFVLVVVLIILFVVFKISSQTMTKPVSPTTTLTTITNTTTTIVSSVVSPLPKVIYNVLTLTHASSSHSYPITPSPLVYYLGFYSYNSLGVSFSLMWFNYTNSSDAVSASNSFLALAPSNTIFIPCNTFISNASNCTFFSVPTPNKLLRNSFGMVATANKNLVVLTQYVYVNSTYNESTAFTANLIYTALENATRQILK